MKNLFILPTDKPSRLFTWGNKLRLGDLVSCPDYLGKLNKNICITFDEEIKEGDLFIGIQNQISRATNKDIYGGFEKKIILTTDQDLIKDGVQSIDDNFLEWFVKNPTCEFVEVDKNWNYPLDKSWEYKLRIIPKEEPKQEFILVKEECSCIDECLYYLSKQCKHLKEEPKQEIWKDIPDYEGLYQVSNFGNVKSLERYVKGKVENRLQKENILSKRLVGNLGNQYYAVTLCNNKDRKQIKVSVLVAMAFLNHTPNGYVGFTVDHIDNNPLNNNVNNLQVITKRENSSKDRKGISKYTGVTFNKKSNKWRSQIWINGKNKTLGSFDDELEAHRAYQKELQQHLKS
jgi:hypothetical protein